MNKQVGYVGESKDLNTRVCSYFRPSILNKADREVLAYFKQNGFENVRLTLYILDSNVDPNKRWELERYYVKKLNPNLNVYLVERDGLKSRSLKFKNSSRKSTSTVGLNWKWLLALSFLILILISR